MTAMKKNAAGSSRLFLIEFLTVLFFFLIISTVCLRLFVASYRITGEADALSHAQAAAASVCETFRSGKDLSAVFPESEQLGPDASGVSYVLCFDRDFNACSANDQNRAYTLTAMQDTNGHTSSVKISVTDTDGEILYEFFAGYYTPLTREEALS